MYIQDQSNQTLSWNKKPKNVLLIKKISDSLNEPFIEILKSLINDFKLTVYIEDQEFENDFVKTDNSIMKFKFHSNEKIEPKIKRFVNDNSLVNNEKIEIDFIITLGGDGTLLHVSSLFKKTCPPVLSIHLGSLGFLCPFDFENYQKYVNGVIKGNVPLLYRNRLRCKLEKIEKSTNETENVLNEETDEHLGLNEIIINRGPNPFLSNLDLYINDYLITTVQGDGLIISTPTGSTAYAMAAGASMCHPSVQAIVIVPICPHSLSFRPIIVPANANIKIELSLESRQTAFFSIDGRNMNELKHGYALSISTSDYPLPTFSRSDQISDWFEGLANCLNWNQRPKQLPLSSCYMRSISTSNCVSPYLSKSSSTSSLVQNLNMYYNENTLNVPSIDYGHLHQAYAGSTKRNIIFD